jgi:ribosomal protein L37E
VGLLILAKVALLAVALPLLALGLRGRRVDDHPLCRRCGFDLFGLPQGSRHCSECGGDLSRRRATRTGRRERRGRFLGAGSALLVAAVLGPAAWFVGAVTNPGAFARLKPVWLLARELEADAAPASRDAAFAELHDRRLDDRLDPDELDALAEQALARQADPGRPWSPAWARLFERVVVGAPRATEQRARFDRQQWLMTMAVRRRVLHGGSVALIIKLEPRFGSRPWGVQDVRVTGLTLGPVEHQPPGEPPVADRESWTVLGSEVVVPLTDAEWARLAVGGVHEVRATVEAVSTDRVMVATQSLRAAGPVRIEAPLRLRTDPALRQAVTDAVSAAGTRVTLGADGRPDRLDVTVPLSVRPSPVGFAWDVSLRADGREYPVGIAYFRPNVAGLMAAEGVLPPAFTADRADVVLRPSRSAASMKIDLAEIWGEPLVIPDQPIRWDLTWVLVNGVHVQLQRPGRPPATQPATRPATADDETQR